MSKNHPRAKRMAHVEIRSTFGFIPIRKNVVDGPKANAQKPPIQETIPIDGMGIQASRPPQGVEAVDWVLLIHLPVIDSESAEEKIRGYRLRWKFEEFFRTLKLKSGGAIEKCRLNTSEKLKKITPLKSIVAFKGMDLAKAAASYLDEDWTQVLSHEEWPTLYRNIHQTLAIPTKPTSVL